MPSTEERIEAREKKQELTRPTNPIGQGPAEDFDFSATSKRNGHTVDEVKAFRTQMFDSSMALIDKKGADYNRDQQNSGDTLFNLRVAEILGIVPSTEEGILVRLSDKFMRLISLTKPGREAQVKDESVLDTIRDIHNYADYLGLIWQKRRNP